VFGASLYLGFSAMRADRCWPWDVLALCSHPEHLAVPDVQSKSLSVTALTQLAMHSLGRGTSDYVITNKLAITCFSNCFILCLS